MGKRIPLLLDSDGKIEKVNIMGLIYIKNKSEY